MVRDQHRKDTAGPSRRRRAPDGLDVMHHHPPPAVRVLILRGNMRNSCKLAAVNSRFSWTSCPLLWKYSFMNWEVTDYTVKTSFFNAWDAPAATLARFWPGIRDDDVYHRHDSANDGPLRLTERAVPHHQISFFAERLERGASPPSSWRRQRPCACSATFTTPATPA